MKRLDGLDLVRGAGIVAVVFLHSATFHFEGITQIDFDDPPLLITVIGLLLTWAGLFAIVSSTAYAYTAAGRNARGEATAGQMLKHHWVAAGLLLLLHYIYFVVLGPKLLDVVHGQHQYALLPGLIATGTVRAPPADRLYYSTTLSMIAWNLFLTAPLLYLLTRRGGLARAGRNSAVLIGLGTLVIVVSLARIQLYPLARAAIESRDVGASLFWGYLVNKNNPILPYLGYGLYGTWLGLALARGRSPRRVLAWCGAVGALWVAAGLTGLLSLPDTMLEREIDLFWYFLSLFQLGLFLAMIAGVLALADYGRTGFGERLLVPLRRLGMVSLSVFMLETVVSQVFVRGVDALYPGWRLDIGWCLLFGGLMSVLWIVVVPIWARLGFRYSVEWLTGSVFVWLKTPSAKMTAAASLQSTVSREKGR